MANEDFNELLRVIQNVNLEMDKMIKAINSTQTALSKSTSMSGAQALQTALEGEMRALQALEAQYKVLNQYKGQYLSGVGGSTPRRGERPAGPSLEEQRLLKEQKELEERQRILKTAPLESTRPSSINEEITRRNQLYEQTAQRIKAINSELEKMRGLSTAPLNPAETLIPTPGGAAAKAKDFTSEDLRAEMRAQDALNLPAPAPKDNRSEMEKLKAERLQVARETLKSEKRYQQALKVAEQQGFGIQHLTDVDTMGTGDIQRLKFRRQDEMGVKQNLDVFSSPSGRASPGISNQFRTFGQGIVRDIGELTKWSIALAAVYGPVQKLQELTQTMIENQTKLAEATITVNSSFLTQGQIFDTAAAAANAAGEEVTGVIDAFTQAYRAAGGGTTQVERFSSANFLLADSLTLSKLSTLDQAGAIDTLAAALRQTGRGLSEGTELLDSWVRVTKVANVDLTALATGFAVVGDAAEAAGVGVHELNGVIAAIAETGIGSGKEVANVARALVAGFQSDNARKELESLGIAVQDTTGQMRPFLDVMQEIYNLRQSGAIDDTQFSKLTLALGGGTRRQAAYSSFIENFDRVFAIANESEKASGDAEAALAKQLDTVQTSITQLGNAFESLAQTMGTEGGFLGLITEGVNGLASLVKLFDSLTGALGKTTPALLAFVAASAIMKYKGIGSVQDGLRGLGQSIQPDPEVSRIRERLGQSTPFADRAKQFAGANILGSNAASGAMQGLLFSAIPALMNATNEDDRFGKTKAGADVVGGVVGGIVGSLTGPQGTLIGAAIGTAIADAFITQTVAYETNIFGYGTKPTIGDKTIGGESSDPLAALKDAEIGLYKSAGLGNEALGRFLSKGEQDRGESLVEGANEAIKNQDSKAFEKYIQGILANEVTTPTGLTESTLREAFKTGQEINFDPESVTYNRADAQARTQYDAALSEYNASQTSTADVSTPFGALIASNEELFRSLLTSIQDTTKKDISGQRLTGDIKGSEYARQLDAVAGFDTKALQYYTALGEEFIKVNKGVDDATEAFEAFNTVIVSGSADSVPEITTIVAEIQKLINLLGDPKLNEDALNTMFGGEGGVEKARTRLAELQGIGASLLTDVYDQSRLDSLNVPQVQGDINKPLSVEDLSQVKKQATALQDEFYQGFLQIPDDMYDAMKGSWDEWAQIVEDSGEAFFETIEGIDPQFFQQAMAKLMEENKLSSQKTTPFGIQQLDMTSGEGAGLQGSIDYFSKYLAEQFPQYEQKPEEFGVIFSDYVTDVLHGDNLAVKLALEKLVDIGQKQLDGMYNIPEGATFWVPLTAAYYKPDAKGSGGGIDTSGLDTAATGLDEAAAAIHREADAIAAFFARDDALTKELLATLKGGTSKEDDLRKRQVDRFRGTDVGIGNRPENAAGGILMRESTGLRKSEETGGRGPSGMENFLDLLKQAIISTMMTTASITTGTSSLPAKAVTGQGSVGGRDMTNVAPTVNARLDFRVDSTTTLLVDGRVLASVITPYLASDLLRLEASQGTITKRYVI